MKKTIVRTLIPCCLALVILLCAMPVSHADKLQDALNEAVPFGIAHADGGAGLLVYKTASTKTQIDTLADYQVCVILSTSTSGQKTWLKIRYLDRKELKEGYIQENGFYQLTIAGLTAVMNDSAAAAEVVKLIQDTKSNQFVAQAQPTEAPTATPKKKATATPASSKKRYVLNTKTMKFHLPSCSEVDRISAENKKNTTTTRESLISQGYEACQKCNP